MPLTLSHSLTPFGFSVQRYRSYMKPFHFSRSTLRVLRQLPPGLAMLAAASTVFAHAHLVSSQPAMNAEVAAPAEVTIHFTDPLEPAFSKITLTDANGNAAATTASLVDKGNAKVMHLPLPPLSPGRYTAHWVAVATDGHRTQGDVAFAVK
jgi:copper resistance protein C